MNAFQDPWPFPGPRVLVEDADATRRRETAAALGRAGYSVAACSGPTDAECPLVCDTGCAYVDRADVVVTRLAEAAPDVVAALRLRHGSRPLVVDDGSGDVVVAVRALLG